MKKATVSFVVFLLAFLIALGFLYLWANTGVTYSRQQERLVWHGQIENAFGTYDGELFGDLFSGSGHFRFLSGEFYAGSWHDGEMEGNGTVVFPEIGEYNGEMSDSQRNGQGTFQWYTGERYTGEWKQDEMSGHGSYTFSNSCTVKGEFSHNRLISGTLSVQTTSNQEKEDTQILSMTYSFSAGETRLSFVTKGGVTYEGELSGMIGSGKAEICYPSGNTYVGQLEKGKRNGQGRYTWKDKSGAVLASYDGEWKGDHMEGEGRYWFSGRDYPYMSGRFSQDVPSGTLVYYKEAGNTFETKWENGVCISIKET